MTNSRQLEVAGAFRIGQFELGLGNVQGGRFTVELDLDVVEARDHVAFLHLRELGRNPGDVEAHANGAGQRNGQRLRSDELALGADNQVGRSSIDDDRRNVTLWPGTGGQRQ